MKKHMLKRPGHIWIFITCFAVVFVSVLLIAVFGKLDLADENSNEISKNESLSLNEEVNEAIVKQVVNRIVKQWKFI